MAALKRSEQPIEVIAGAAQEVHAIAHILDGRVDLVCDAGGQAAHRFELLRQLAVRSPCAPVPSFPPRSLSCSSCFLRISSRLAVMSAPTATACVRRPAASKMGRIGDAQPESAAVAPRHFVFVMKGLAGAASPP